MPFLTLRSPLLARSAMSLRSATSVRTFSLTARRTAMSESDTHRHDEGRNAEIDKHKKDSVDKAKGGKGEWKKELASNSEAALKADRGEIDASQEGIDKLEKETQELLGNKK